MSVPSMKILRSKVQHDSVNASTVSIPEIVDVYDLILANRRISAIRTLEIFLRETLNFIIPGQFGLHMLPYK